MTAPSAPEIPSSETLYNVFFARWAAEDDARAPELRGDLEEIELQPGAHLRDLCPLPPELRQQVRAHLQQVHSAAAADFARLLHLSGPPSLDWLDALEAHATPERLQGWLRGSDPANAANNYLMLCCELGVLIAHLLRQRHPALQWIEDIPYFESVLFDLNRKTILPVFHWAVKTLSGDERHPLREKILALDRFLAEDTP